MQLVLADSELTYGKNEKKKKCRTLTFYVLRYHIDCIVTTLQKVTCTNCHLFQYKSYSSEELCEINTDKIACLNIVVR